MSKEMKESLVEVKNEQSPIDGKHCQRVITVYSSEGNMAHKVILEKSTVKMAMHIRLLYVRAHFNVKPISKVLVNNISTVNVMPLRMFRALGNDICGLIETLVFVSTFIGQSQRLCMYFLLTLL